tara:strand:+ start:19686 stop:19958 length:273 start_codon:yes stop_codon:yes gene_type:complete
MHNRIVKTLLGISLVFFVLTATAHDPKEHTKEQQAPDCASMKDMKMKMNDPITQAMMQQCEKDMHAMDAEEAVKKKIAPTTEQHDHHPDQ